MDAIHFGHDQIGDQDIDLVLRIAQDAISLFPIFGFEHLDAFTAKAHGRDFPGNGIVVRNQRTDVLLYNGSAQDFVDSRQYLAFFEGLGNEIHGPQLEAFFPVFERIVSGDEDDGYPAVFAFGQKFRVLAFPKLFTGLESIGLGHFDIHGDQIGRTLGSYLNDGFQPVFGLDHLVAAALELVPNLHPNQLAVIDNQNTLFFTHGSSRVL
jgi:hypothetical protein